MRDWIKKLRLEKNYTQSSVAEKLGISQSYYNLIENGERQKKLSMVLVQKLIEVFGVTFEYICEQERR